MKCDTIHIMRVNKVKRDLTGEEKGEREKERTCVEAPRK